MGIADKSYYENAAGELVDEGAEDAAFLVVGKGGEITAEMADKYGIGKVAQQGEQDAAEGDEPAVKEKAAKPAANKSKKPTENKGAK